MVPCQDPNPLKSENILTEITDILFYLLILKSGNMGGTGYGKKLKTKSNECILNFFNYE